MPFYRDFNHIRDVYDIDNISMYPMNLKPRNQQNLYWFSKPSGQNHNMSISSFLENIYVILDVNVMSNVKLKTQILTLYV